MNDQEPINAEEPHEDTPAPQLFSRRRLLRMLAATGGVVAADMFLPSKWLPPVLKVGVLPVHAQGSQPTSTPMVINTATSTPTATATPTATDTPVATDTDTATPTVTDTPVVTDVDTPTITPTVTDTPVATDTDTPTPTATDTATPTETNTAGN